MKSEENTTKIQFQSSLKEKPTQERNKVKKNTRFEKKKIHVQNKNSLREKPTPERKKLGKTLGLNGIVQRKILILEKY